MAADIPARQRIAGGHESSSRRPFVIKEGELREYTRTTYMYIENEAKYATMKLRYTSAMIPRQKRDFIRSVFVQSWINGHRVGR